jgi:scyllo-inositol 2-dehydrogenase (NADP+)
MPIKTAVIGFGLSAQTFHLPFLRVLPAYKIVAISTRQMQAAQTAFPLATVYASGSELLADTEAELVIITAPNAFHFDLAKQALESGLHVVLEKPFVNSVAEGQALIALATERKKLLSVFHNRRWDGDFLTVKRLIQNQTLGPIHFFESHFDRFRPQVQKRWREEPGLGAGSWFDLGSHLLDQALCLFGMPQAVTGRCLSLRPNAAVTDFFDVRLHYRGCEVALHGSPFAAGPKLRFEVQGSLGTYRKYGLDPQEERLKAGLLPENESWAAEPETEYGQLYFPQENAAYPTLTGGYQHYFKALAQAINLVGPLPVPAKEALDVIRLLEMAERSSELGQTLSVEQALTSHGL